MDRRLQRRYLILVEAHCKAASELAAGVGHTANAGDAWTAAQGAWRFLNNKRVRLDELIEPLREAGRHAIVEEQRSAHAPGCAILVHDWSKLDYRRHTSKKDVVQLTHETDIGYELTTALLVSAANGSPLAPMEMHVKTKDGLLSTRNPAPPADEHRLEQILDTMDASHTWGLSVPLRHVKGTGPNGIKLSRNLLLQQGVPQYVTWLPHQGELLWASLANAWFRAPAARGIDDEFRQFVARPCRRQPT